MSFESVTLCMSGNEALAVRIAWHSPAGGQGDPARQARRFG